MEYNTKIPEETISPLIDITRHNGYKKEFEMFLSPDSQLPHLIPCYRIYWHAIDWIKKRISKPRLAIDAGAHIGTMSWIMADDFFRVEAFEPLVHRYIKRNCIEKYINVHPIALGDKSMSKAIYYNCSTSGGSSFETYSRNWVSDPQRSRKVVVQQKSIDSFNFRQVDFIKIDVESYELPVLVGAEKTIKTCSPLILIEIIPNYQPPEQTKQTFDILDKYGYKLIAKQGIDYLYAPKQNLFVRKRKSTK